MIGIKASSLKAKVGESWTSIQISQLSSSSGPLDTRDVAYGNNYYVAQIRPSGLAYSSYPSGPWTINTNSTWSFNDICYITYENGYWFVPSRSTSSLYMSDVTGAGTSFTSANLRKVIWHSGSSKWVGINGVSGYSFTSAIGNFTMGAQLGSGTSTDIATDGTTIVVVQANGTLYTSTNPTTSTISWTSRTSSFGVTAIRSVDYNSSAGYWVATGENGTLAYSTNGTTWTQKTVGLGNGRFNNVKYFNGKWFILDDTNRDVIASSGSDPSTSTYSVVLDNSASCAHISASNIMVWLVSSQTTSYGTLYASR